MASGCQEIYFPKRSEKEKEYSNSISEIRFLNKRLVGSGLRLQSWVSARSGNASAPNIYRDMVTKLPQ